MKYEQLKLGAVLEFWFEELSSKQWFVKDEALDTEIKKRFIEMHRAVAAGEYWKYRSTGESLLAEIIVLDQFSRNMFRDTAKAFAHDSLALALSQQVISAGLDANFSTDEKTFLYMPFMHSESKAIHTEALALFESLGDKETLKYEKIHKDIIDRFGRYPHRNEVLNRASTPEEVEYLATTSESFF